jgi:ubiquinone/menaquinone biosynthesis C-methylase UbiE
MLKDNVTITWKSRLIKLNGKVPDNMVFLHADALQLPFKPQSFNTIISLNLFHCLVDTKSLLTDLKTILSADGKMFFTTLIKANRLADKYLNALANSGKLVFRSIEDHQKVFDQLGISIEHNTNGNIAFIYYKAR